MTFLVLHIRGDGLGVENAAGHLAQADDQQSRQFYVLINSCWFRLIIHSV